MYSRYVPLPQGGYEKQLLPSPPPPQAPVRPAPADAAPGAPILPGLPGALGLQVRRLELEDWLVLAVLALLLWDQGDPMDLALTLGIYLFLG